MSLKLESAEVKIASGLAAMGRFTADFHLSQFGSSVPRAEVGVPETL